MAMKIKSIDDSAITFDNGMDITFDHVADYNIETQYRGYDACCLINDSDKEIIL